MKRGTLRSPTQLCSFFPLIIDCKSFSFRHLFNIFLCLFLHHSCCFFSFFLFGMKRLCIFYIFFYSFVYLVCLCIFVATRTYLVPSFNLLTFGGSHCRPHSQTTFGDFAKSKVFKMNSSNFQPPEGVVVPLCHSTLGCRQVSLSAFLIRH